MANSMIKHVYIPGK